MTHPCEQALLDHLRQIQHGEVVVKVQDGIPVLIVESTKRIKLA
jgi:hypothetical protein